MKSSVRVTIIVGTIVTLCNPLVFLASTAAIASAAPSGFQYNFRDDFNYPDINSMVNAGWAKCPGLTVPDSYYTIGNGILTLQNDGYVGAAVCHDFQPRIRDWNITERLSWSGQPANVAPTGTLQVVVFTASHVYFWVANGYFHTYRLLKDFQPVGEWGSYQPILNTYHIMTVTMNGGIISLYIDKQLIGSYTEDPTSNNDLTTVDVQSAWQTNNNFDYVILKGTPAPDFTITSNPATRSVPFGQNVTFTITLTSLNNFASNIQLSPNIAPQGTQSSALSLSQSIVSLTPGGSATSTLLVQTYLLPTTGNFAFNVNATGSSIGHHVTILLTVAPLPSGWDFAISLNPNVIQVSQADISAPPQASSTATVTSIGFTGNIALTARFYPPPIINYTFKPSQVYLSTGSSASSTLSISFPTGWPGNGNWTVTIIGSSGELVHSAQAAIVFLHSSVIVTLSRHTLVLKPGTSASTTVTLENNSTQTYRISFSAHMIGQSNYGPVLTWTPTTNPITLAPQQSYSATLVVQAPSYIPVQQYTIDLEVFTDSGLHYNQTIPLYVTLRNFTPGVQVGTWATYDFSISTYPVTLTAKATVLSIDGTSQTSQVTTFPISRLLNIQLSLTTIAIIAGWIILALTASLLAIMDDHRKRRAMAA